MDQTQVINLRRLLCYILIIKRDNILQKHIIISFKIILEKLLNTGRDIDIESLPSDELEMSKHYRQIF
jgi:hypothetical protein